MRYVLSRRTPAGSRILLIESGSRFLMERVAPLLRSTWAASYELDLVTCYGGAPEGLPADARIFRVGDYGTPERRRELIKELRARDYAYAGMICSAEPIMTKWKWMLVYQTGVRTFLINENADYVWFDRLHWKGLTAYASLRLGFEDSGAVRTLVRIVLLPFSLMYLSLYALRVHALRALRQIGS